MYQLVFQNKIIKCNSIQEWHKKIIKLEKEGLIYKRFVKDGLKYKFYYV